MARTFGAVDRSVTVRRSLTWDAARRREDLLTEDYLARRERRRQADRERMARWKAKQAEEAGTAVPPSDAGASEDRSARRDPE